MNIMRRDRRRHRVPLPAAVVALAALMIAVGCSSDDKKEGGSGGGGGDTAAPVTAVKGSACAYFVNVGLFGGPQQLRGCGEIPPGPTPASPGTSYAPNVALPADGSGSPAPITATDTDGAKAQYGPAVINGGLWPDNVASPTASGPMTATTEGTTGPGGTVKSSAEIGLKPQPYPEVACYQGNAPPCVDPGGFGPPPVYGDSLRAECSATETGVTGSATFTNGHIATATDAGGAPLASATEDIPASPPVNYTKSGVITNVGDVFTVVFNEQIVNPDKSLTVNAIHMYLFGPTAVGEMVRGQAVCGTTPSTVEAKDTVAPTCGTPVVEPLGPEDPTPKSPRTELIGVFDAGGLKSIDKVQVTNGKAQIGDPSGAPYLQFKPGQTGPAVVTFTRNAEAETANLPLTWSFDATDMAGNVTHCPTETTATNPLAGGNTTTT